MIALTRRHLLLLLKAAVSILLLYISLRSVHLEAVTARLSQLDPLWIAAALALPLAAAAQEFDTQASHAVIMDYETGMVLYSKNGDAPMR